MPRVAADQYVSKVRMPEDIDLFWGGRSGRNREESVGARGSTRPIAVHRTDRCARVFLTSLDRVRIAGWYAALREREGKLPGLLQVPGYNMEPPAPKVWARKG